MLFLVLTISISKAQEKGIQFVQNLSWQQVLEKAKAENKYIFIDCFATWCGPCKEMDRSTYPDEKVGDFFNAHFISVKVQMDSSKNDVAQIRSWYADARRLQRQYVMLDGAVAYPAFLFFSPEGKIVDRFQGLLDPQTLISIGREALDFTVQYYTLLEKYRNKELADTSKPTLAIRAKLLGSQMLADSVGYDYVANYLLKLPPVKLYTRVNWIMLDKFTRKRTDPGFAFMLKHANEINQTANDAYYFPKKQVMIILNNEVIPETKEKKISSIGWNKIERRYTMKYGQLGKLAVLQQRLAFAFGKVDKDYSAYEAAYMLYFNSAGSLNVLHVNNCAWIIFQHSQNPKILELAIKMMAPHKNEDAEAMDTYANLLYKAGHKNEAMEWEKKAVEIDSGHPSNTITHQADPAYRATLQKMQKGEKTW